VMKSEANSKANMNDTNSRDKKPYYYYPGHEDLQVLSQNYRFNDWVYEQAFSRLNGDILEVGSGIGTFSEKIVRDFPHSTITLTDLSLNYVRLLKQKFRNTNTKVSSHKLDLNSVEDYERLGFERFDSIVAINVLEHVENDEFVLQQLYRMLKNGGTLVILVPCHKFLYNVIDAKIGHFRRYNKTDLESKIKRSQFTIDQMFYFNALGIIGWYVNGNLAKSQRVNRTAAKLFDTIVPLLKYVEKIIGNKIGLSIVGYLLKN
jgi:SAM-dependent methyltransferase